MANQTDWAEATEQQVLDAALTITTTQGWTWPAVRAAGKAAGLSVPETELLLPHGPADLAALLSRRHDARALAALPDPASLKIRERIRAAVEARIDAAAQDEAAVRRWSGYLALPLNFTLGLKLLWESADALWRWAGDTATDENHYTKRVLLAGILSGAGAIRMSTGRKAALEFVDRRIDNVMAFEKWKATTSFRPSEIATRFAEALGRARYPSA